MSPEPFPSPFEVADVPLDRVVGSGVDADAFEDLGWEVLRDPIFATFPAVAEAYRDAMGAKGYTLPGITRFVDVFERVLHQLRKTNRADMRQRLDAYARRGAALRAAALASGGAS